MKGTWRRRVRRAFYGSAAAVLTGMAFYLFDFPDVRALETKNPTSTAYMRLAQERARERGEAWHPDQRWAKLEDISPALVHAVLISEDISFFQHKGIDFDALGIALERDLEAGRFAYGASTISQQLARNLYLSPSKNPLRKVKEALITMQLEKYLKKERILELYLNVVEWGDEIYGAEAASEHYFGKKASILSPEEAVMLAVALPSPRKLGPDKEGKYLSRTRKMLLDRLVRGGYTETEFAQTWVSTGLPPLEEMPLPPIVDDDGRAELNLSITTAPAPAFHEGDMGLEVSTNNTSNSGIK